MFRRLLHTERDYTALLLRLALGALVFPHGAQKLLGWYGGFGFEGTMAFFASIGVPALFGLLVIASDFFGSLLLVLGLLGRVAAFGTFSVMLGAMLLVHWQFGFWINWDGSQPGEGIQFHLLAAVAIAVMVKGSGAWSLDRLLAGRPSEGATSAVSGPKTLRAA